MNESSLLENVLLLLSGFYLGVFLCEKAGLKFKTIGYPFVFLFTKLKNIIHREDKESDAKKEEK